MLKILDIEFINHPFFKSLKVELSPQEESLATNYTTLIIGPNGTGKSKILNALISIFNSLESISKNPRKKYSFEYNYKLRFINEGLVHFIDFSTDNLFINGYDYQYNSDLLKLPSKIIISAFSFNDKYPLREQRGKVTYENYHYLGLKSTNNNIFLSKPTRDAISNLYNAVLHEKDIEPLSTAFKTLELIPELTLIYKPGKNFKFLQNFHSDTHLTPSQFQNSFSDFSRKKKKGASPELKRLGNEKIEKILDDSDKIQTVINFIHRNIYNITRLENKEIPLKPYLNFNNKNSFEDFINISLPFQLLSDLEIISFQRLEIKKQTTNFSFDDASSGEYHIIIAFINILSILDENSLVLLDEPEISLHPNWQIKYMDIFNKIFKNFPNSHFIIASHSHFLVSDLQEKKSSILAIDRDEDGSIKITSTPKNTYGWSAEQILLDIFKVVTTRNYYISNTITDVLKEMAKVEPNFQFIKNKLEAVIFLDTKDFNEHDPLLKVFKELKSFYNELN